LAEEVGVIDWFVGVRSGSGVAGAEQESGREGVKGVWLHDVKGG
jgi:hypothetical protein